MIKQDRLVSVVSSLIGAFSAFLIAKNLQLSFWPRFLVVALIAIVVFLAVYVLIRRLLIKNTKNKS